MVKNVSQYNINPIDRCRKKRLNSLQYKRQLEISPLQTRGRGIVGQNLFSKKTLDAMNLRINFV